MATQSPWSPVEGLRRHGPDWVQIAQTVFSFDPTTARRLTFVRWLRATGRLRGDDVAERDPQATWPSVCGPACDMRLPEIKEP